MTPLILSDKNINKVPNAPLKKSWHEMVMKRMLRYAAERGFDGIVWSTGETNADHYGQRAEAGWIEYHEKAVIPMEDDKPGARTLRVESRLGRANMLEKNVSPEELPKYIGKEMADKLLASKPTASMGMVMQRVYAKEGTIVGGEGMIGFYNDILPRFMRSYTRKWGGAVRDTYIPVPDEGSMRLAARFGEAPNTDRVRVHSVEITEPMREMVLKGQPLFQRAKKTEEPTQLTLAISDEGIRDVLFGGNLSMMEKIRALGSKDTIRASIDHWRRFMQDRFLHWHRVQSKIEQITGKPLAERINVYGNEELFSGRAGSRLDDLERKHKEPIIQKLADFKNKYADGVEIVEKFLYALHAGERNTQIAKINPKFPNDGTPGSGGSGMDQEEIDIIMKNAKESGQYDELMDIATRVHDMLQDSLRFRLDSGLISKETYDIITDTYKYYVPLRGLAESGIGEEGMGMKSGKGKDIRGKEIKSARGRKSKASDILAHSFALADEAIIRGEKNRVGQALYRLVKKYPSDMWEVATPAKVPVLNKATGLIEYRAKPTPKNYQLDDYTVGVKVDGVQKLITLKDKRLAEPMKNLHVDKVEGIWLFLLTYNRYLSQVNTTLNPEFIITNAFRDLQTALINIQQFDAKGLSKATRRDYFKALKGAYGGLRGKEQTEWQRYMREFDAAGGKVNFFKVDDLNARRTKLQRELDIRGKGALPVTRRAARAIMDLVEDANGAVENAIRLSAFVNARRMGMSDFDAARLAKNLTVNFNKRGELGTQMNGLYLFYNASIQSTFVMLNALKSRPVQYMAASLVAMGFAEALLNYMLSPPDDDGELVYDKIPQWEKEGNIILVDPTGWLSKVVDGIFVVGKVGDAKYIKVPLAYGYRTFHELGRATGAAMAGKDTAMDAAANVVHSIVNNFNPIGGDENIVSFFAPTILDPLISVGQNRTFTGSKIRPEPSQFDKSPPPPSEQYFPNVSDISRVITRELNELTGGDKIEAGKISLSPEVLDYMFAQFTGAAGAFVGRTVDAASKIASGEEASVRDIPFARQVLGGKQPWYDRSIAYERMDEVLRIEDMVKDSMKVGMNEKAKQVMDSEKDLLSLRGIAKETREQLSLLRKRRVAIENSSVYSADQKEAQVKKIEETEQRIVIEFNKRYLKAVSE